MEKNEINLTKKQKSSNDHKFEFTKLNQVSKFKIYLTLYCGFVERKAKNDGRFDSRKIFALRNA